MDDNRKQIVTEFREKYPGVADNILTSLINQECPEDMPIDFFIGCVCRLMTHYEKYRHTFHSLIGKTHFVREYYIKYSGDNVEGGKRYDVKKIIKFYGSERVRELIENDGDVKKIVDSFLDFCLSIMLITTSLEEVKNGGPKQSDK